MVWYSCVNLASGVGHLLYTRVYTVSSRGRLLFGLRRLKKKKKTLFNVPVETNN